MSNEVWKKLMKFKIDYRYKTMDDVLKKMFETIQEIKSANQLIKQGGN